jgi:uncharacterized protein YdcH (DUF465 family)
MRLQPIDIYDMHFRQPANECEKLERQLAEIEAGKRRASRDEMDRERAERLRGKIRDAGHKPVCRVKL